MNTKSEYMSFKKDPSPILEDTHLYIENHLRKILGEALVKPEAVLKQSSPSFSFLIDLCEAMGSIGPELSNALRKFNSIRNKYAHRISYEVLEKEADAFIAQLRNVENTQWFSYTPGSEYEFGLAVNALGTHFEINFGKLGLVSEKKASTGAPMTKPNKTVNGVFGWTTLNVALPQSCPLPVRYEYRGER